MDQYHHNVDDNYVDEDIQSDNLKDTSDVYIFIIYIFVFVIVYY
jgi:hypothetical protein